MSKYDPLRDRLLAETSDVVTFRFAQIEALVPLPAAAKRYAFWWSNDDVRTTIHVQSKAWGEAGFRAEPNLRGKLVTFRRSPPDE